LAWSTRSYLHQCLWQWWSGGNPQEICLSHLPELSLLKLLLRCSNHRYLAIHISRLNKRTRVINTLAPEHYPAETSWRGFVHCICDRFIESHCATFVMGFLIYNLVHARNNGRDIAIHISLLKKRTRVVNILARRLYLVEASGGCFIQRIRDGFIEGHSMALRPY
jgi:hypothetical protein